VKILAIRGCNLASLAGEFEIDLARGPLAGAGVFAIVGNTGAGKSTLLDALCVALFDRTPRLTNHSTVKVGRGSEDRLLLGAQDVRTLLRRGAVQGWAEVDFESGDAQQYRARWSVRRARGQTDGTLQDQQVTLTALDGLGERLGGTKTETLRAIVARLGLSFDQFRRSALLAQGEFAAFLRAECAGIVLAAPHHDPAVVRQPRRAIEQRHAQRVEQRALARAGVADDREHPGPAERRAREIDLEFAGEAREVAAADREDLHDASGSRPSPATSPSSLSNAASTSALGGST